MKLMELGNFMHTNQHPISVVIHHISLAPQHHGITSLFDSIMYQLVGFSAYAPNSTSLYMPLSAIYDIMLQYH
jgi:hypothetical protein